MSRLFRRCYGHPRAGAPGQAPLPDGLSLRVRGVSGTGYRTVMDRRSLGSWLGGANPDDEATGADEHPGARLGLPKEGSGSVPGLFRRLVGLLVDWLMCSAIGYGLLRGGPWVTLGVFALEHALLVGTLGFSFGHRLLGIRVVRVDGCLPGPLWALVRTILLCTFVPALFMDRDLRGMHDRAANTMTVRF